MGSAAGDARGFEPALREGASFETSQQTLMIAPIVIRYKHIICQIADQQNTSQLRSSNFQQRKPLDRGQQRASKSNYVPLLLNYNKPQSMQPMPLSTITLQRNSVQHFSNASTLTHYTKDIIPGQYEGGFKLWECTLDMLQFMESQPSLFEGKRVLQIGCGHGVVGILAQKLGAVHVCLQDYNLEVIEKLTKPTLQLNQAPIQKFSFLHGDWQQLKCEGEKFDVVVGCELIYNQQNYEKILGVLGQFLKLDGMGLLGNKTYYFGVGGNMVAFKKKVQSSEKFKCESLLKISPSVGGNKKEIVRITF